MNSSSNNWIILSDLTRNLIHTITNAIGSMLISRLVADYFRKKSSQSNRATRFDSIWNEKNSNQQSIYNQKETDPNNDRCFEAAHLGASDSSSQSSFISSEASSSRSSYSDLMAVTDDNQNCSQIDRSEIVESNCPPIDQSHSSREKKSIHTTKKSRRIAIERNSHQNSANHSKSISLKRNRFNRTISEERFNAEGSRLNTFADFELSVPTSNESLQDRIDNEQRYREIRMTRENRFRITEKQFSFLKHKITKLLNRLESEYEAEIAATPDEECVICINSKATMKTFPCGHQVVCGKCFVKTIQMVVSQRMLPLRCVICRAKILRLKQSTSNDFFQNGFGSFSGRNDYRADMLPDKFEENSFSLFSEKTHDDYDYSKKRSNLISLSSNDRGLMRSIAITDNIQCAKWYNDDLTTEYHRATRKKRTSPSRHKKHLTSSYSNDNYIIHDERIHHKSLMNFEQKSSYSNRANSFRYWFR